MKIPPIQPWPTTAEAAIAKQRQLSTQVITRDQLGQIQFIAGVDAGFVQDGTVTRAAVAVLNLSDLQLIDHAIAYLPTTFPYIPGLLSFREVPAIMEALQQITTAPDLILCDGQGLAHPRRFGIACHLGVLLDCPTIGVAKSRLIGTHNPVPDAKGHWSPLMDRTETIGAVLRSRDRTNPLYVSIGHRISLSTAIDYVLRCTPKYRLPETTRWADKLASNRQGGPKLSNPQTTQPANPPGEQMELF
ncbi:MAG: deoxyribonuclease V [Cyanobacteria bacterium J06635_15]